MTYRSGFAACIVLLMTVSVLAPVSVASPGDESAHGGAAPLAGADYMRFININGFEFDPLQGVPDVPEGQGYDSSKTDGLAYYIVQFNGPITRGMKEDLSEAGATVLHYVNYNAFVVRADKATIERAQDLPVVRWAGLFEPAYKLSPRLAESYDSLVEDFMRRSAEGAGASAQSAYEDRLQKSMSEITGVSEKAPMPTAPRKIVPVEISVFEEWNLPLVLGKLERLGAKDITYSHQSSGMIRADLSRAALTELAREVGVMWIDRHVPEVLYNDIARWVVQSGDSLNHLTPIHDHGITGTGQTVTVCDSGLDYEHDAFQDPSVSSPGATHRKVTDYYVPEGAGGDLTDNGGNHGTHTSGTVAGDDGEWHVYDGDCGGTNGSAGPHDGQAFDAMIHMSDMSPDGYGVYPPADFSVMYQEALDRDSWIHTNSWGSWGGEYSEEAAVTDDFIWDNQDFLVIYSAGNDGASGGALNPEAAAKNVIAVGASHNGALMDDVAYFSSRGPVADGRLKPDIMAPGVDTWSADGGDPDGETDLYDQHSGTSMAAPTVAGSCALIRQYYMDGWYPTGSAQSANEFVPSAALIKATIINSGAEMTGSGAYDMGETWYPNNNQGWGRVTLDDALYFAGDPRVLVAYDERTGLSTGETAEYQVAIGGTSEPFEVTLVWSDYPGTAYSYPSLVNDLDLVVTNPDGTVYIGNQYEGYSPGESAKDPDDYDRLNNVEGVLVISDIQAGVWTVDVTAHNTPMGPQPYALVVTGEIATDKGVVSLDRVSYQSDDLATITVADSGLDTDPGAIDTAEVLLSSTTEVAPETVVLVETGISTSVFEASVQLELDAVPTPDDGILQVQNLDVINASYYDEDDGLGGACWTADYAGVDDDPPIISGVSVTYLRAKSCKIAWSTDELSNSTVWYGTGAHPTMSASSASMTVSHVISLSRLEDNQTYVFAVGSTDRAENEAYDDNGSDYYKFTTPPIPPSEAPNEDWPTFQNNFARLGVSPSDSELPLELIWSASAGGATELTSPILSDGVLVTQTLNGWLSAWDPYTGTALWSEMIGDGSDYFSATPAAGDGVVYTAYESYENGSAICAMDIRTGDRIWSVDLYDMGIWLDSRPIMALRDGMVFACGYDAVFALDAEDGSLVWCQYSTGGALGVTVTNGLVYAASRVDSTARAFDEHSGDIVWERSLGDYPAGPPSATGEAVYAITDEGLWALDAFTGEVLWNVAGLGYMYPGSPVCDGTTVYIGSVESDTIYAFDAFDGTVLWQSTEYYALNSMAYANGYLYGAYPINGLVVRDPVDGTVVETHALDYYAFSYLAVSDGWVYIQDSQGTIYAFRGLVPIGLEVSPTIQTVECVPASTARFEVSVENIGYAGADTFDIELAAGTGTWVTGLFEADGVTPLEDTDSDLVVDTGPLESYESTTIVVLAAVPADAASGDSDTAVLSLTSSADTDKSRNVTATAVVPLPGTDIGPSAYSSADPGDIVIAAMEVENTGGIPDTIDIEAESMNGWDVTLLEADGSTLLADTDGDSVPDVGLLAGFTSATIVVELAVPIDAETGVYDRATVTACSSLDPAARSHADVAAELLGEASSEWETFRHDAARSGVSPIDYELPLTFEWASEGYYWSYYCSPVVADHTVYFADTEGDVQAMEVSSGAQVWRANLEYYGYPGVPTVSNGLVYLTCAGDYEHAGIVALDQDTGAVEWLFMDESLYSTEQYSTPAVALGNVYWTESSYGRVYANDALTGDLLWEATGYGYGSFGPTYWAGMLFVTGFMEGMTAFDAMTGEEIWTRYDVQTGSAPVLTDGILYVADPDGRVSAIDPFDGSTIWQASIDAHLGRCSPLKAEGMVFVGGIDYSYTNSYMWGLDADTGDIVWETDTGGYGTFSSPAYSNGVVYAQNSDGYLRALDASTGYELLEEYVGCEYSSPAIADGYLLSSTHYGSVQAFSFAGTGIPVAASASPDPLVLGVGEAGTIEAVVTDVYGNPVPGVEFEWESLTGLGDVYPLTADGTVAAYVAGIAAGTDVLEFTSDVMSGTTTVEILPGTSAKVVISPASVTLGPGETAQFSAAVADEFGNPIGDAGAVWSASLSAGVIDSDGTLVASVVAGTGTVTATVGSYSASALVTILPGEAAAVSIDPPSATVAAGSFVTVEATAFDEYGNAIPGAWINWSCTDGSVIPVVDGGGLAVFVAPALVGQAYVTAAASGFEANASMTVVAGALARIVLSPEQITVQTGQSVDIEASWVDAYGNGLEEEEMDWDCDIGDLTISSDETSAEFHAGSSAGEGSVTVSYGDLTATASVTVVDGSWISVAEALVVGPLLLAAAVVVLYLILRKRKGAQPADAPPPAEPPPAT